MTVLAGTTHVLLRQATLQWYDHGMAWGFLDWVRGRRYQPDPDELALPPHPSDRDLQDMVTSLLDDQRAYRAFELLKRHARRAKPLLEVLTRDDARFRSMTERLTSWSRPRYDAMLTILFEWKSEWAVQEVIALAPSPDPALRMIAARLLASTGESRFASILRTLTQDSSDDVRKAVGFGLWDVLEYGHHHGRTFDEVLGRELYDYLHDCALRTDRGPCHRFAAAMFRCDRSRALIDLAPERALRIDRNCLRDLIRTLEAEHVEIPLPLVTKLLDDAMAIVDQDEEDRRGMAGTLCELLCLLAKHDAAAATERMRHLQSHGRKAAREAAQDARQKLSPDPFAVAAAACEAAGGVLGLRQEHRVVYLVNMLDIEVCNGGWLQWVANSSGQFARETLDALVEIKAEAAADELRKVMQILGPSGYSSDQEQRIAAIDRMMNAGLGLPDDGALWSLTSDMQALVYDYAEQHPEAFGRSSAD